MSKEPQSIFEKRKRQHLLLSETHNPRSITDDVSVMRQELKSFLPRLRNEHPVKRITVNPWQIANLPGMM